MLPKTGEADADLVLALRGKDALGRLGNQLLVSGDGGRAVVHAEEARGPPEHRVHRRRVAPAEEKRPIVVAARLREVLGLERLPGAAGEVLRSDLAHDAR